MLTYSMRISLGMVPQLIESAELGQLTSFLETQVASSTRQGSQWWVTKPMVWPSFSALAVLPLLCTKIWWLLGQSQWTTKLTSGMSRPLAATSVTMRMAFFFLLKLSKAQVLCSMSIFPQTPQQWYSSPTSARRQSTWNLVETKMMTFSLLMMLPMRQSSAAAFSSGRITKKSIFMVSGRAISWWTQLQSLSPASAKSLRSGVMVALNMRRCEVGQRANISFSSFWNLFSPKSWSASSKTMTWTRESLRSVSVSSCMSLPGVAMMISGLMERLSNCPSQVCPPRMRVQRRSILWRKALSTLVIWSARSRVGMRISALAPLIWEWDCSLLMMGRRQERVLPDPVLQQTTTSFPYCTSGIAFFWTGVGFRSLFIIRFRNSSEKKLYCAKPFFCTFGFCGCASCRSYHSKLPYCSSWLRSITIDFCWDITIILKGYSKG